MKTSNVLLLFKSIINILTCVLFFILPNSGKGQSIGQFNQKIKVFHHITPKAYFFDLQDVKLLESPFLQNLERNGEWLLRMNVSRLMHSWKVNAGIATKAVPLGGWEALDGELRGHTAGHVLSGLALMFASTGNEVFKNKGDSIVRIMAECQQVLNQEGYLSAFPQNFIDRCIAGKPVWAPWYTLHKIFAGLTDMYLYTGNKLALEVVTGMGGWAYRKLKPLTSDQLILMLKNEFGGMNDIAYTIYGITGNGQDKELAEFFRDNSLLSPLLTGNDKLAGLHANTQIPKIIGEARGYELTGNPDQKKVAEFFWSAVINHHTYCNGGNSDFEHFFKQEKWMNHIFSPRTTETCNTYNMLKLTKHLYSWTADTKYTDYYEQALYNHILAAQDPKTGMASYFMPLKSGLFKVYSTENNSFWCCVGSSFESHAKYAGAIYHHDSVGLFVNLFIPSELNWKEKDVKIIQQTNYPEEAKTCLTFHTAQPVKMPVRVRYPSWAVNGASVKINGKNIQIKKKPGSYIVIDRIWKSGDKVELYYPMELRLVTAPHTSEIAAIAYGPVLLAGRMGTKAIKTPAPYAEKQNDYNDYPIPDDIIDALKTEGKPVAEWLKPVPGNPLEFTTIAGVAPRQITLVPYYKLHDERYVVYWKIK